MIEEWKPVIGFEGFYEVSNMGNVRSTDRLVNCSRGNGKRLWKGKELKQTVAATRGYNQISLSKEGVTYKVYVHTLVAKAWLNGENETVNHKDGNKQNNKASNLEWCSYSDNSKHAYATGLKYPSGGRNGRS